MIKLVTTIYEPHQKWGRGAGRKSMQKELVGSHEFCRKVNLPKDMSVPLLLFLGRY